ncbi:MAG: diguanylate cyclase [Magnetococcales bacterium]|nr:diguanylate cyclase [Magnetococcales bacterium]
MARILVVDDDSHTIEHITKLISDVGHTPVFILEPAFVMPKLEDDPVDLILLDVNMPDINGLMVLDQIRATPSTRDIPVIMITGESDEKLIRDCFERGAVDFLRKPVRRYELISRISIALKTRAHIVQIQSQHDALSRSKELIETILHSMDDGICVIDGTTQKILECNRVFVDFARRPRDEIIGTSCHTLLTEPSYPCDHCPEPLTGDCPLPQAMDHGACTVTNHTRINSNGTKQHYRIITTPILDAQGRTNRVLYLVRDITQSHTLEEKLRHLAFHDVLTGLPNRQLFFDRLNQSLAHVKRQGLFMAVMFFDLDKFKVINDTLGHDVGDKLLKEVAKRLRKGVRESDTVARLGGDEFTAILTNISELEDIESIAEKILDSLSSSIECDEHKLKITSSIGISVFPFDGHDAKSMIKKADDALYKVKEEGRNDFQFNTDMKKMEHKLKKGKVKGYKG